MKRFITPVLCVLLALFSGHLEAQDSSLVKFTYSYERLNDQEVLLTVKAKVSNGNLLYAIHKPSEDAVNSELRFDTSVTKLLEDTLTEKGKLETVNDPILVADVTYTRDSVLWQQKAKLPAGKTKSFDGTITYMVKKGEEYLPGEEKFFILVKPDATVAATSNDNADEDAPKSLWGYFLVGFLAGLGAFIMPCIYAMVPVTVSFFTKRSTTRQQGIRNAIFYSLSIIGIFTATGFLITLAFGPGALNAMASSAVFNIFVFAMFLVFGFSFLGAFEITLPSSWTNKIDSKANLSSYSGIFFMALTLVIVSFSCTVPFIGGLTVWTSKGGMMAPLVGFFGFSLALSLPFALFAFFPALLNKMAKSGGWLNTIKVSLGFIELALAMKFLSSADLAYHWRLLDREIYLAVWIVVFGLLGLYLLGKLKFHHDDDLPKNDYGHPYLTVTRLLFAILFLSFTVYMIPGLWGAPLKGISAWVPEMRTQDFNLAKAGAVSYAPAAAEERPKPTKFTDILESEVPGVEAFFDYEEAQAAANKLKKPLMIDFTGHSCANCRKMEQEVFSDPEVMKRLQKDFVVVSLYVDDKYRLPEDEWYTAKDGSLKRYLGDKNLAFEVELTSNGSQPQYVFTDEDGSIIKNAGGYDRDIQRFVKILEEVKAEYAKRHP